MTTGDKAIAIFRSSPTIRGTHPLTGLPVHFVPFEPAPMRAKILVLTKDATYYTADAGLTWEDATSIDIRQIDVVLSKNE